MKADVNHTVVSLPADLLAEVEAAAEREHRTVADVLHELIAQGLHERRIWKERSEKNLQRARDLGLLYIEDDLPMTDEYRESMREKIAQGLQSLRDGKGTDGEAFFAQMYTELDELTRLQDQ